MSALQHLIESSPYLFSGAVREQEAMLQRLEKSLGVSLPPDVRWFWLYCGSGLSQAAPSVKDSIADTVRFRSATSLPSQYVVLENRNDAGAVLLDTASPDGSVIWLDFHAIDKVALGSMLPTECDCFPTFADWVGFCIEQASDAV